MEHKDMENNKVSENKWIATPTARNDGSESKTNLSLRGKMALGLYRWLYFTLMFPAFGFAPILGKFSKRVKEGFNDYFGSVKLPRTVNKPVLWVHGVSMGESMVALGFAKELKKLYPNSTILFTTTHPDVIKDVNKKKIADAVAYFPLDNYLAMSKIFDRWKPDAIFVSETDFWPEFSQQCRKRNIPLFLINGRISSKIANFYTNFKSFADIVFGAFSSFAVQSEIDAKRLIKIGVSPYKIHVLGNMKADFTHTNQVNLSDVSLWLNNRKSVVFGSLHPEEFSMLKPLFRKLVEEKIAVIIAPRNISLTKSWKEELEKENLKICLKTDWSLQKNDADRLSIQKTDFQEPSLRVSERGVAILKNNISDIMLLDTIGELASVYKLSSVAFVGGSLDKNKTGGHNPLEVLQQNVPLLMGNYYRNFSDIVEQLKTCGGISVIENSEQGYEAITSIINNITLANKMICAGNSVLEANKGVVDRTLTIIKKYYKNLDFKQ